MNSNNIEEYTPATLASILSEERYKLNKLWIAAILIVILLVTILFVTTIVDEFLIFLIYDLKPCP